MSESGVSSFLQKIWSSVDGDSRAAETVTVTGEGSLPSVFAVTDLAATAMAAAGLATARLIARRHGTAPNVAVDRRLASFWYGSSLRPDDRNKTRDKRGGRQSTYLRSRYLCSPESTSSPRWLCKVAVITTRPVVRWGVSAAIVSCGYSVSPG